MKRELKKVLRLLTQVQADPRVGPDEGALLKRARRELRAEEHSGKLDEQRIVRATEMVLTVLQHIVDDRGNGAG